MVAWVEALSALGLVGSRTAWAFFWAVSVVLAAAGAAAFRRLPGGRPVVAFPRAACLVPGAVLAAAFVVALAAAPNNWDSMVYHNARVMEWWDHGSVAPWETPIDRQVRMPPLASYFKLALFGLTGNDVLFNLVQWVFFLFSILAAAALARRLVPSDRAGPWAALLVATIPIAILEASSTQNDVVVAGYLLSAAFFLARAFGGDGAPFRDLALGGAAVGAALATKGTVFLLASPMLGAAAGFALARIATRRGRERRAWVAGLGVGAALVILPSAAFWWRTALAIGSPVGPAHEIVRPSAFFSLGPARAPALAASQVLRSAALQLGQLRVVGVRGKALFGAVERVHRALGIRVDEPALSGSEAFADASWQPLNHEDSAPSTTTFLILVAATGVALLGRPFPGRRAVLVAFAAGWAGWLLVALFVRWMPWNGRLQLPALVLLSIPAAAVVASRVGRAARVALACALALQALPPSLLNWSRPLLSVTSSPGAPRLLRTIVPDGSRSIFATSRWEDYFRNRPALRAEVEDVMGAVGRRCVPGDFVRLDLADGAWEYALWAGGRRFAPGVRLRAGVARPGDQAPCAIVRSSCPFARVFCLDGHAP